MHIHIDYALDAINVIYWVHLDPLSGGLSIEYAFWNTDVMLKIYGDFELIICIPRGTGTDSLR